MFKKLFLTTAVFVALGATPVLAHCGNCGEDDNHAKGEEISAEHGEKHEMEKPNLVTIAAENEDFSTLVAALTAADLVETLTNAEDITVFAPTNDAFAKLPEGTVEDLLKPENKEKLQAILKYHVVGSKIKSKKIEEGTTEVETLEGSTITVTKNEDGVMVNDATVTKADIYGSNGVIHVIDSVILPN